MKKTSHFLPVVEISVDMSCRYCPEVKHIGDDSYCPITGTNFGEGCPFPYKMYPYQKECPYLKKAMDKAIKKFCQQVPQ
jgi:hypothetical protein